MYAENMTNIGFIKGLGLIFICILIIAFLFYLIFTKSSWKLNAVLGIILIISMVFMTIFQVHELVRYKNLEYIETVIFIDDYEEYINSDRMKMFDKFYLVEDNKHNYFMTDHRIYKHLSETGFGCYNVILTKDELAYYISDTPLRLQYISYVEKVSCKKK